MHTIELTTEQLEVLRDILSIELYDYLNDRQIEVWREELVNII